jgi:hypothetical protein
MELIVFRGAFLTFELSFVIGQVGAMKIRFKRYTSLPLVVIENV